jgi:predicted dehydrogenase
VSTTRVRPDDTTDQEARAPLVYRVGIIGCGAIASDGWEQDVRQVPGYQLLPYSHAGVFRRHPKTRLVAAADTDPQRLRAFGERWGVRALYLDHREMLAREDLEVVSIATPTRVRHALTLDVARSRVRGIFMEKPVARTLGEVDEMIAACRSVGIKVAVNHYRTYDPYFRAARALILNGEIGELRGALATWKEGFSEGGCHLFDLLRYTVRSEVDWVFAHLDEDRSQVDPGGNAYLVYRNGVRTSVHMPWSNHAPPSVEFLGSEGMIRMGFYQPQWWKFVRHGNRTIPVEWPFPGRNDGYSGMYMALDELLQAMDGGAEPASTLEDARTVLEITVALLKSGQSGEPVRLPVTDTAFVVESWL